LRIPSGRLLPPNPHNLARDMSTGRNPEGITADRFRAALWSVGLLSVLTLILWGFPAFWYTKTDSQLGHFWLTEETNVTGWTYHEIPVSKAAEAVLVADRLVSGEFSGSDRRLVRVFSAKRYVESSNEIGLFVHTPDRCWTESGWEMEPIQPEFTQVMVHGIPIRFERRVFASGVQRELVYFAGLVGGQPLPYRLDHNLSVGMKHALHAAKDQTGTTLRASDQRFWRRVWDSFISRRRLIGPKQFVRISTPVSESAPGEADAILESFLPQWLRAIPYESELSDWKNTSRLGHATQSSPAKQGSVRAQQSSAN
jgi:hypothetical protein